MSRDSREAERIWDLVMDETIRYIEAKADGVDVRDDFILDLRRSYAENLGKHRYNNSNMDKLVKLTFTNLRTIEDELGQRGDREKDIIRLGVEAMVDGHFAESVFADPKLVRELPREAERGMEDAIRLAGKLAGAGRRRGGRDDRDDDRDRDRGGARWGNRDDDRDRDRDRGGRDRDRRDTRRSGPRDSRAGNDGADHWDILSDIGVATDERDERGDRDERDEPRREREPERREPEYEHPEDPLPHLEARNTHVDGPDHTRANPYDDYWLDNEHWRVAHKSGWKLTGDGEQLITAVPTLYDVNQYIKYYVMNESGEVREELVEVDNENKQLAHSLREDTQGIDTPKAAPTGGISLKALKEGTTEISLELDKPGLKLGDLIKQIPTDQLTFGNALAADSVASSVFQGRVRLNSEEAPVRVDVQFLRTPIAVQDIAQLDLVAKVGAAGTLTQAAELMEELKPQFEKPVFELLNKRFTENLLRSAKYQFQFDKVAKLNFSQHYGRFLTAYGNIRGAGEAAQFAQRVGHVTTLSTAYVAAEEIADIAGDLIVDVKNPKALVFLDVLAVASFGASIDELGIGLALTMDDTGLAVTQASNRDLYTSLRGLYSALEQQTPPGLKPRLLLSTSDNRLIEVLPYACRTESFILAAV
ncbi:hypothetical protein D3C85_91220 [compost metagenome]